MPEMQRDAANIQAIELPAAYSQGGHVQFRTILMPLEDHTPRTPEELKNTVSPGDLRQT